MRSRSLALVAVLLLAAAGSAAAPAPGPGPGPAPAGDGVDPSLQADPATTPIEPSVPNTTNYLALPADGIETARVGSVRLDVGSALALGSSDLRGQYNATRFAVRLERGESDEPVLRRTVVDLRDRVDSLQARQRAAITAYNRGQLSTRGFVREMAVIDRRARLTRRLADEVVSRANSPLIDRELLLEARYVRAELDALAGPVRQRAGAALTGERETPFRVYVETSADGVVLATVGGGLYVREAYLDADRSMTGDAITDTGVAYDLVTTEHYPWAGENVAGGGVDGFLGGTGGQSLYRLTVPHTQGTLIAYLDGQSGEVFKEVQVKRLAAAPTNDFIANSTDDAILSIGRTHPGGQLMIGLSDPATGEGIAGVPVYVGDDRVGTTGEDGVLYTLQPRGSARIVAEASAGNVSAVS